MLRALPMRLTRRPWKFLFPGLLLFFFGYTLSRSRFQSKSGPPRTRSYFPPLRYPGSSPNYCENFPVALLDSIQVVLKTGAGDAEKNRVHINTITSCITNLIIVSDHEEQIGEHTAIDILSELPGSYAIDNADFQAYAAHKKAHAEGDKINYSHEGTRLDRFKFLPMVDKAYAVNPRAKWYVFLESDIYFFWDTLFRQLEQLDPTLEHYLGSPAPGSDDQYFAYGGAGIVLSQGLMKNLIPPKGSVEGGDNRLSVRYEDWAKDDQRGDAVLANAIRNATGAKFTALYPTFSGDELKKVKVDRDRWCTPLLSLHRLSTKEMEDLWKWERTRPYNQKPFVYSSLLAYTHSHLKKEGSSREWWDNLSEAPVPNDRPAHRNAGSCGSECSNDGNCLQWSYSQTVCRFANYVKLGNAVDRENGGQGEFTSGWELRKLGELGFKVDEESDINDTCEEVKWLTPKA